SPPGDLDPGPGAEDPRGAPGPPERRQFLTARRCHLAPPGTYTSSIRPGWRCARGLELDSPERADHDVANVPPMREDSGDRSPRASTASVWRAGLRATRREGDAHRHRGAGQRSLPA